MINIEGNSSGYVQNVKENLLSPSHNIVFISKRFDDDLISMNDSLLRNTYVGVYMEFENNVSLSGITTPERYSTFYDITDNSSDVSDWTSLNPHPMVNI